MRAWRRRPKRPTLRDMRRALAGITAVSVAALCLTTVAINNAATASPSSQARSSQPMRPGHDQAALRRPRRADPPARARLPAGLAGGHQPGDRSLLARGRSGQRPGGDRRVRALLAGPPSALRARRHPEHPAPAAGDPPGPRPAARSVDAGREAARRSSGVPRTILWIAANVHGNEPSGGDAVVQLLYELADRSDCVARAILGHSIVGLIPVQNPDGRAHDTRYNGYSFDMNRDGPGRHAAGGLRPAPAAVEVPAAAVRRRAREQRPRATSSRRTRTRSTTRRRTSSTGRSRSCTARRTGVPSRPTAGATRPGSPGTTSSPRCTATPSRPPRWARSG